MSALVVLVRVRRRRACSTRCTSGRRSRAATSKARPVYAVEVLSAARPPADAAQGADANVPIPRRSRLGPMRGRRWSSRTAASCGSSRGCATAARISPTKRITAGRCGEGATGHRPRVRRLVDRGVACDGRSRPRTRRVRRRDVERRAAADGPRCRGSPSTSPCSCSRWSRFRSRCWRPTYHVLGTDKVGQDVLYLSLKSIRTGLVIGTLTTLVMLPLGDPPRDHGGLLQGLDRRRDPVRLHHDQLDPRASC